MSKRSRLDIDRIAFFGRTYAEYLHMFGIDEALFADGPVLDCPAGASSFAAEACHRGFHVTACDILYHLSGGELLEKGRKDISHVFEKFDEAAHLYTWNYYKNKGDVSSMRKRALELFAGDFNRGKSEGRYIQAVLPVLPFSDKTFSRVLSSNFLFLYGDRLDVNFHAACLKELVRVCSGEVRIFPLVGLDAKPYPCMNEVLSSLTQEGIQGEIVEVPFEFQRGANQMLKLR